MGFTLQSESPVLTELTVFIEFDPPAHRAGRAMNPLGAFYARWCVRSMLNDAARAFPPAAGTRIA